MDNVYCPFCGGLKISVISKKSNIWRNQSGDFVEYRVFSARCNRCHARGTAIGGLCAPSEKVVKIYGKETCVQSYNYYRIKAIAAWNNRTKAIVYADTDSIKIESEVKRNDK